MRAIACLLPLLVACGGSQAEPERADPNAAAGDSDLRVSRSRGEAGGYVVLWPRIVPAEGAEALQAQAALIQARLAEMATEAAAGRPVDVRPEPERVCRRRGGCTAAAIGAVLMHAEGGCAVVATASEPGESPTRLAEWAGSVDLINDHPPFREPPEEHVRIHDMQPCEDLAAALDERAEDVLRLVRSARRSPI